MSRPVLGRTVSKGTGREEGGMREEEGGRKGGGRGVGGSMDEEGMEGGME